MSRETLGLSQSRGSSQPGTEPESPAWHSLAAPSDFSLITGQGVPGTSEGQKLENLATGNDPKTVKLKRQVWHIFRM